MKCSQSPSRCRCLLAFPVLIGAWSLAPATLNAAASADAPTKTAAQQTFASPEDAMQALRAAAKTDDHVALRRMFGPDFDTLLTGDAVEDANNVKKLGGIMEQSCQCVGDTADQVTLMVGSENWPFPIPLVKAGGNGISTPRRARRKSSTGTSGATSSTPSASAAAT